MLRIFKILFSCMLLLGFCHDLRCQIQVIFQPQVNGKTLQGIQTFQVANRSLLALRAEITITVTEQRTGKVAQIKSADVLLRPGMNSFFNGLERSRLSFGRSAVSNIISQTNKLPEGEYEYCYEVQLTEAKPNTPDYFENCFNSEISLLTPLLLVNPLDEEKICDLKPMLTWQAPMPFNINGQYGLVLCEVKNNQTSVEALSFNSPVINVAAIKTSRLMYPPGIPALVKGKKYAWQVAYSVGDALITKSEIWTFKIECEEEKKDTLPISYRELKETISGDYYVAFSRLDFALYNSYGTGELKYSITSFKDPRKEIKNLPRLMVANGSNKYSIDLSQYKGFERGEQYLLTATLATGQKLYLRFVYEE